MRHVTPNEVSIWLITTAQNTYSLLLKSQSGTLFDDQLNAEQCQQIPVGKHAFVTMLHVHFTDPLPTQTRLFYDITLTREEHSQSLSALIPTLCYQNESLPSFTVPSSLEHVFHGSCRKPHHDSKDGLLILDQRIQDSLQDKSAMPDLLMMSGDQVYTDDVAGPMLQAIHQVIDLLGLFHEELDSSVIDNSQSLIDHEHSYYKRPMLLPDDDATETFYKTFFKAKSKPIFTSVNANNHLIAFNEVIAMYCLVWSDALWPLIAFDSSKVAPQFTARFTQEQGIIEDFVAGLHKVRRALAHVPVYMIFDDHDITDDWNLTRGWEEAAYGHPFGKRIIGNALAGYWLCQGWGNQPNVMAPLTASCKSHFSEAGISHHNQLVDTLLDWSEWHYHLNTEPKFIVLDTRTHRWRSESDVGKPSGLMDWEALSELQQELIDQPSVIMVSAAPIFGVKLIEVIQRIFTFFGKALMVDAENWMAHKGTASVILNIFRNPKTPKHFVILSGDVHYSFIYDITLRFKRNTPRITQITCSGIKNTFPDALITWFDRLNHILYHRRSPLNWFTRRRNMKITPRIPTHNTFGSLHNGSGIGELIVKQQGALVDGNVLGSDGKVTQFSVKDDKDSQNTPTES